MNPDLLFENFDELSGAPDAIPRLRRLILDLAVQGKLVERDPNDEPALVLLTRIKEQLRESKAGPGAGRPPKALKIPFESLPILKPSWWEWARLIEIADVSYGFAFESSRFNSNKVGLPLIRIRDISSTETETHYDGDFEPAYLVRNGDYLVGMDGDFNVRQWKGSTALLNQRVMRIKNWRAEISAEFFAIPLQLILQHLHTSTSKTTVKHLSAKQVNGIYLPLPPLPEQCRIIEKVNELMALCDRLEASKNEEGKYTERLVAASMHHISSSVDSENLSARAGFCLDRLAMLTSSAGHIQQLRQAILNLGISGKLVAQDQSDEPALDLLDRIGAEKQRLFDNGIIPRQKATTLNAKVALSYRPPVNWETATFSSLCNVITSGSRGWAAYYAKSGPKFIRAQNIRFGKLRLDDLACVSLPSNAEGTRTQVSRGDLFIVITGAGVTNPALIEQDIGKAYVSQHVALIKPTDTNLSRWLLLFLMAPYGGREELVEKAYGAGKPGLNLDNIRSLSVPIPPLPEQRRIVAMVDELMFLCDRLEAQLSYVESNRSQLLEAVICQVVK